MKQLTKQELSAYFPYEVEMIFEGKGGRRAILQTIGTSQWGDTISIGSGGMWLKSCGFKHILYPLSHLTKEIEHKGEKFVPYEKLGNRPNLLDYRIEEINFQRLPYELVTKLHEWHFDTFGLIERGLAIDKTTL